MASTAIAQPAVVDMEKASLNISFQTEAAVTKGNQIPLNESCTAYIRDIMANVGRADLQCSTPSGMVYSIPGVNKDWIEEKQRNHELISGYTQMDLPPTTMIDATTHALILDSPLILRDPATGTDLIRRRRLSTAEKARGKKTVLVVRVEASDSATTLSETQLASDVFGDNGDPNNLRSQYLACSYGKFDLNKAENRNGLDTNIRNGVVTVEVPNVSKSVGDTAMLNAINKELGDQFSTAAFNLADFVIYCMPPGVMHPLDVAYAFMDGYKSIYNDQACNQVSTQLHEVGHNLNMAHSGMGADEYADKSGMMGYSFELDDLPYMCFNAAKSWQLGWYADKALRFTPSPTGQYEFSAKLAGVADYATTENDVVIKIEQEFSTWAYFVNYNAAKGINAGTQYGKDRVLVTMKDTSDEANTSKLVARLRVGQNLKIRNFNGRADEELIVGWKSRVEDVATLRIFLQGPNVPEPTQPPSIAPSILPSFAPTLQASRLPTIPPSINPSFAPTPLSSAGPTSAPSISPSSAPSIASSAGPSSVPTIASSAGPSSIPTPVVSDQPTLSHLPTLSLVPSKAPTTSETPTTTDVPSHNPSTSLMPSAGPSSAPSQAPSQSPSLLPSQSQLPSSSPSMTTSEVPSFMPSDLPSSVPSRKPSSAPSMKPSVRSSEFESMFVLQLPRGTDFEVAASVCAGLQSYLDEVTKSTYGNETVTSISCLPIVEALGTQNVFDRGADVTVVMTSSFPMAAIGPNATEFESYVDETIGSGETSSLLPGIILASIEEAGLEEGSTVNLEWDDETFDTPVLKVGFEEEESSSSGMQTTMHLVCTLSSLYLLFFL